MNRPNQIRLLALLGVLLGAGLAVADNTTSISRLQVLHPNLGHSGGAGLHSDVAAIYTRIGDNMDSRYQEYVAQADSTTVTVEHNFNVPFADMNIVLWDGVGSAKTVVVDAVASGWTIVATPSFLKTKINVTTPSSGGPRDFTVEVKSGGTIQIPDVDFALKDDSDATKVIKFNASGLTTGTTRTYTGPNASTTLVGTDVAQVLTAKDFDGGTASNTSRVTLPKASTSTLTALTRKEATVVYDTTTQKPYFDNGTSLVAIGSGTSSDVNFVTNGGAEDTTTPSTWATYDDGAVSAPVDGTGGSPATTTAIARTTTAGELIFGTGTWKFAKSAANGQGEGWAYDFTLPPKSSAYSSLVALNFDYYFSSATADEVRVYLYDKDTSTLITPSFTTCGGGTSPILSDQTTSCHAQLAWVSTTSDDYRLIVHVAGTGTTAWNLFADNIYTGTLTSQVGAAVGEWQSYTGTVTASGGGSVSVGTGTGATADSKWRRIGDSMEVQFQFAWGTASTAFGTSGSYRLGIPSGYTVDSSKLPVPSATGDTTIGHGYFFDTSASDYYGLTVTQNGTGLIRLNIEESVTAAGLGTTSPVTIANSDAFWVQFTVPISEWAGGTAFGDNSVEYASNSSTTDAADTTSFAYGPSGSQFGNFTVNRTKTVRFRTPILANESVEMQISSDSGATWNEIGQASETVSVYQIQNTNEYGATLVPQTSTDVLAKFYRYRLASGATFGAAGTDWSAIDADPVYRWRVVKYSSGQPVGFGLASTTAPGLTNPYTPGSGVSYGGFFTPTISSISGTITAGPTTAEGQYNRNGPVVSFSVRFTGVTTNCNASICSFRFTVPETTANFTAVGDVVGSCISDSASTVPAAMMNIEAVTSAQTVIAQAGAIPTAQALTTRALDCHLTYRLR